MSKYFFDDSFSADTYCRYYELTYHIMSCGSKSLRSTPNDKLFKEILVFLTQNLLRATDGYRYSTPAFKCE